MLKAYTITELAQREQMTKQGILYRVRKGGTYIPVRMDGAQYARSKKGYTVRYIVTAELKEYMF